MARMSAVDKLSRAWGHARANLGEAVPTEIAHLFSRQSLAMMAVFAAVFVAAQLTPAGWVADAVASAALTSGYAQRSEGHREGMGGGSLPGHRLDGRENVRRGLRRRRNLSLRQQRTGRRNAESAAERLGVLLADGGLSHNITGVWSGVWEKGEVKSVEAEVTFTRRDGSRTQPLPVTSTLRMEDGRISDYTVFMDVSPLFAEHA